LYPDKDSSQRTGDELRKWFFRELELHCCALGFSTTDAVTSDIFSWQANSDRIEQLAES
jgi:hypothetical protein